jgi:hypothetical protein
MALDPRVPPGLSDDSSAVSPTEDKNDGCRCPYCGRVISNDALEALGYAPTEIGDDEAQDGSGGGEATGSGEGSPSLGGDDAGIVSRFNASRPRPLQADEGRAAGLMSAARRMVKNRDY